MESVNQLLRDQVIQIPGVGRQTLEHQVSHPRRPDALGGWVDRGQGAFGNVSGLIIMYPVLGMDHFQAALAKPRFPVCLDPGAVPEAPLLCGAEVEEPEVKGSGIVFYSHHQVAAATIADTRTGNTAHHQAGFTISQRRNRRDACTIFIANGEMEEQIPGCMYTQLLKFICQLRTDPAQRQQG